MRRGEKEWSRQDKLVAPRRSRAAGRSTGDSGKPSASIEKRSTFSPTTRGSARVTVVGSEEGLACI